MDKYKISDSGSDFVVQVYEVATGKVVWSMDPHGDKETYEEILDRAKSVVEAYNE